MKSAELSASFNDFFDTIEEDSKPAAQTPSIALAAALEKKTTGGTAFLSSKARKKIAAEEIARLKLVVANPDYKKNAYSAIHEHYKAVTK